MSNHPIIFFKRLQHAEDLPLPSYAHPGDAGIDLSSAAPATIVMLPGNIIIVPTGFCVEIPEGYEGQVRGRSGNGRKGIIVAQGVGTIDSGYRGEIGVQLANYGREPFHINRGDRIAQLVIAPVARAIINEAKALSPSARGEAGFGSTGS